MDIIDELQARVLGCLIEKQITTPDYYPMTLNALVNACNQKSNRHPVMSIDERTIVRALDVLREKQLACRITSDEFRVPKYEHWLTQRYAFSPQQVAVLCELMLRGPQTAGELRGHASRMQEMDMAATEQALELLKTMEGGPFVMKLPRAPGQKEPRFLQLFCGAPDLEALHAGPLDERAVVEVREENERIQNLENRVEELSQALEDLRNRFEAFVAQFQ